MVPTGVVEDTTQPRRGETMRSIMMRVREMPVVRILLEQHALSIVVHGMVTHGHHPSHSTRFPDVGRIHAPPGPDELHKEPVVVEAVDSGRMCGSRRGCNRGRRGGLVCRR